MSKLRMIDTRFWSDGYVIDLDPSEKLLFIYLFTNSKTDICGAYEAPSKLIALETGIDREMVEKMLDRFERDRKIVRSGAWVYIVNFKRHQRWNKSMEEGARRSLEEIPQELAKKIDALDSLPETATSLGTDCQIYKSESKSESKSKSKREGRGTFVPPTAEEVEAYCRERGNRVDSGRFTDFYASKGWMVGRTKMRDWKAAVRGWEARDSAEAKGKPKSDPGSVTLHDGSRAAWKWGRWVDADNPNVAIDVGYYPELTKN